MSPYRGWQLTSLCSVVLALSGLLRVCSTLAQMSDQLETWIEIICRICNSVFGALFSSCCGSFTLVFQASTIACDDPSFSCSAAHTRGLAAKTVNTGNPPSLFPSSKCLLTRFCLLLVAHVLSGSCVLYIFPEFMVIQGNIGLISRDILFLPVAESVF